MGGVEVGLTGGVYHNEGVAQHGCYIHSKEEHKQETLQFLEAREFQEDTFFPIGAVALAHDGGHPPPGLPWGKMC